MSKQSLIVWNIRLPRVLVEMNLAVSGAIFRAVTRNELAGPFILGVSSGAGLMILLTLVVFSGLSTLLSLVASAGGAVAFLIVYAIAWTTGSLTGTDWEQVRMALPWTVVAMGLSLFSSRQLNVLLLGENTAKSLGMSVEKDTSVTVKWAVSAVARNNSPGSRWSSHRTPMCCCLTSRRRFSTSTTSSRRWRSSKRSATRAISPS